MKSRSGYEHEIRTFLKDSKFLLLFFIVLDCATTIYTISAGLGYEANPVLHFLFLQYGLFILVLLKLGAVVVFYVIYRLYQDTYKIYTIVPTAVGIYLTIRNTLVIFGL